MSTPTSKPTKSASSVTGDESGSPDRPSSEAARPSVRQVARVIDWRIAGLVLIALVCIVGWRLTATHAKASVPESGSDKTSTVAAAKVIREDLYNEDTVTAEFRPYQQVELHAKVSGYLQDMKVDFGDRVKAGQLLAVLEIPELKAELDQANAALKRAQAEYHNAHLIYNRLLAVEKDHPNLVAQQELDSSEAKDGATEAAIASAKAEIERYETMMAYTRITAPFSGVITRRFADPGALIQSGTASATQAMPLVCVSDNYRLRLDFPVSVRYVKDIQCGASVDVRVESLGEKTFTGKIARFTQKVDEATRSMIVESEVDNPNLELVPGMYATVVLKVEHHAKILTVPSEAIGAGHKQTVFVINHGQIEERPVTLGLETPAKYEVTSGLQEGELVFIGSRAQVKPGQKVEAKLQTAFASK